MPAFSYRAQRSEGGIAEGHLTAETRQEALRQLAGMGLRPVRLESAGETAAERAGAPLGWTLGRRGVSPRALENFTRQLSSLLTAGVPLSRALRILAREGSSSAAAERWRAIHDLVVDGNGLADAMARHPDVFPRIYVAMVRSGETGGFLDVVLNQVADFQARERELRGKVLSALTYPLVLMLVAVAVLIFLMTFFIPRFQVMFEGFGAALPALTRAIIAASHFTTRWGLLIAVALALAYYGLRLWLATAEGRRRWQQAVLRVPAVGELVSRLAMTRFCRMLGTLIGAGVPLIAALRVARESLGNQVLVDAVSDAIERVQRGEALAASLRDCPRLFPPTAIEMIAVAEESGQLDRELIRLSNETEKELDGRLRTAVSLTEPILLLLMAAFIGAIFIGMVLPILSIQDYLS
ncbi:MAG TPA: type II secretion system F family protein [Candidatus Sumerlaeota bacterium]|nr:type II secretion system F family protein [Candidatus Sumerlaeota bacterium]HOR26441.1 type II secretion system F family protein [Candidatus Sumerlaeota bacterium]HPK00825.1 type II secretion system F family protein [Candidatus Sumerlaeota bacterium]